MTFPMHRRGGVEDSPFREDAAERHKGDYRLFRPSHFERPPEYSARGRGASMLPATRYGVPAAPLPRRARSPSPAFDPFEDNCQSMMSWIDKPALPMPNPVCRNRDQNSYAQQQTIQTGSARSHYQSEFRLSYRYQASHSPGRRRERHSDFCDSRLDTADVGCNAADSGPVKGPRMTDPDPSMPVSREARSALGRRSRTPPRSPSRVQRHTWSPPPRGYDSQVIPRTRMGLLPVRQPDREDPGEDTRPSEQRTIHRSARQSAVCDVGGSRSRATSTDRSRGQQAHTGPQIRQPRLADDADSGNLTPWNVRTESTSFPRLSVHRRSISPPPPTHVSRLEPRGSQDTHHRPGKSQRTRHPKYFAMELDLPPLEERASRRSPSPIPRLSSYVRRESPSRERRVVQNSMSPAHREKHARNRSPDRGSFHERFKERASRAGDLCGFATLNRGYPRNRAPETYAGGDLSPVTMRDVQLLGLERSRDALDTDLGRTSRTHERLPDFEMRVKSRVTLSLEEASPGVEHRYGCPVPRSPNEDPYNPVCRSRTASSHKQYTLESPPIVPDGIKKLDEQLRDRLSVICKRAEVVHGQLRASLPQEKSRYSQVKPSDSEGIGRDLAESKDRLTHLPKTAEAGLKPARFSLDARPFHPRHGDTQSTYSERQKNFENRGISGDNTSPPVWDALKAVSNSDSRDKTRCLPEAGHGPPVPAELRHPLMFNPLKHDQAESPFLCKPPDTRWDVDLKTGGGIAQETEENRPDPSAMDEKKRRGSPVRPASQLSRNKLDYAKRPTDVEKNEQTEDHAKPQGNSHEEQDSRALRTAERGKRSTCCGNTDMMLSAATSESAERPHSGCQHQVIDAGANGIQGPRMVEQGVADESQWKTQSLDPNKAITSEAAVLVRDMGSHSPTEVSTPPVDSQHLHRALRVLQAEMCSGSTNTLRHIPTPEAESDSRASNPLKLNPSNPDQEAKHDGEKMAKFTESRESSKQSLDVPRTPKETVNPVSPLPEGKHEDTLAGVKLPTVYHSTGTQTDVDWCGCCSAIKRTMSNSDGLQGRKLVSSSCQIDRDFGNPNTPESKRVDDRLSDSGQLQYEPISLQKRQRQPGKLLREVTTSKTSADGSKYYEKIIREWQIRPLEGSSAERRPSRKTLGVKEEIKQREYEIAAAEARRAKVAEIERLRRRVEDSWLLLPPILDSTEPTARKRDSSFPVGEVKGDDHNEQASSSNTCSTSDQESEPVEKVQISEAGIVSEEQNMQKLAPKAPTRLIRDTATSEPFNFATIDQYKGSPDGVEHAEIDEVFGYRELAAISATKRRRATSLGRTIELSALRALFESKPLPPVGDDMSKPTACAPLEESSPLTIIHGPRQYQLWALSEAERSNIVLRMGTGMGKTLVAVMLIKKLMHEHRKHSPETKKTCVFLVPLVPLVKQQSEVIEHNTDLTVLSLSGETTVDPSDDQKWIGKFAASDVIVSTADIVLQSLSRATLRMENILLMVFDEAHHAQGDHAYARIMRQFYDRQAKAKPKILGLTASPLQTSRFASEDLLKLQRTLDSTLVSANAYTSAIHEEAETLFVSYEPQHILLSRPREMGGTFETILAQFPDINGKLLLYETGDTRQHLLKQLGWYSAELYMLRLVAAVVDWHYAALKRLENLEDGPEALLSLRDLFQAMIEKCNEFLGDYARGVHRNEHIFSDKLLTVSRTLADYAKEDNFRSIIFVERRATCVMLASLISTFPSLFPGIRHEVLLGGSSQSCQSMLDRAMILRGWSSGVHQSPREARLALNRFREGRANLLIATSVAEEGLDVPNCNHVFRFDPPQNFKSYLQSRGRARKRPCRFVLFVKEDATTELQSIADFRQCEVDLKTYEQRASKRAASDLTRESDNILEEGTFFGNPADSRTSRFLPLEDKEVSHILERPQVYRVTETGAEISGASAICLVNDYCQVLPSDEYTDSKAQYVIEPIKLDLGSFDPEVASEIKRRFTEKQLSVPGFCYQASLMLPSNAHVREEIKGNLQPSRKLAKQSAALKACEMLHQAKGLDDRLCPPRRSRLKKEVFDWSAIESKVEELGQLSEELPKMVNELKSTGGMQEGPMEYKIDVPQVWQAPLEYSPATEGVPSTARVYLSIIYLDKDSEVVTESFRQHLANPSLVKSRNWKGERSPGKYDESHLFRFGILSKAKLPKNIPSFPLFTRQGHETQVQVEFKKTMDFSPETLRKLISFHNYCGYAMFKCKDARADPDTLEFAYLWVPVVEASRSESWKMTEKIQEWKERGAEGIPKLGNPFLHRSKTHAVFDSRISLRPISVDWEAVDFFHAVQALGPRACLYEVVKTYANELRRAENPFQDLLLVDTANDIREPTGRQYTIDKLFSSVQVDTPLKNMDIDLPEWFGVEVGERKAPRPWTFGEHCRQLLNLLRRSPSDILERDPTIHSYQDIFASFGPAGKVEGNQIIMLIGRLRKCVDETSNYRTCSDLPQDFKVARWGKMSIPQFLWVFPLRKATLNSVSLLPIMMYRLEAALRVSQFIRIADIDTDPGLVMEALSVPSARLSSNYERLEFLGDSVLNLTTSMELFAKFPFANEGQLHYMRTLLVRNLYLRALGQKLGLPGLLTAQSWGIKSFKTAWQGGDLFQKISVKTVADVIEALIGATYYETSSVEKAFDLKLRLGFPPVYRTWTELAGAVVALYRSQVQCRDSLVDIQRLGDDIGHSFDAQSSVAVDEAFTHATVATSGKPSYQRQEWLGDNVYGFFSTKYIFTEFPALPPGALTDLRMLATNNALQGILACQFKLHRHLYHATSDLMHRITSFATWIGPFIGSQTPEDGATSTFPPAQRGTKRQQGAQDRSEVIRAFDELKKKLADHPRVRDGVLQGEILLSAEAQDYSAKKFMKHVTLAATLMHVCGMDEDANDSVLGRVDDAPISASGPPKVLGDIVESLFCAIAIDLKFDMDAIELIFSRFTSEHFASLVDPEKLRFRPVRDLYELAGKNHCAGITFESDESEDEDGGCLFQAVFYVHELEVGRATGRHETTARTRAANKAVDYLHSQMKGRSDGFRRLGCNCGSHLAEEDHDDSGQESEADEVLELGSDAATFSATPTSAKPDAIIRPESAVPEAFDTADERKDDEEELDSEGEIKSASTMASRGGCAVM